MRPRLSQEDPGVATLLLCSQTPGSTSPPNPRQRALALGLQGLRKAKLDSFWANSNPKSLARHLRGSQGHPSQVTLGALVNFFSLYASIFKVGEVLPTPSIVGDKMRGCI